MIFKHLLTDHYQIGVMQRSRLLEKEVKAITKKRKFKYTVCIADGGRDLWLFFRKKYPDAIHVVDFFHVCEHFSKLSEQFFKEPSDAKAWYKKISLSYITTTIVNMKR